MLPSVVASELEQVARDAIRTAFHPIGGMTSATIESTIFGDTQRVEPVECTMPEVAPFDRCDRVEDYRVVWGYFEAGETTS